MISIIVPVYNLEEYVSQTMDSILGQTYSDIEVIIVDDGSTDNTGKIADEYKKKDSRIKVLHKRNEGVTKARIEGVKHANGEWIGFVDGDDIIAPEMYEKLVANAEKYHSQISHCGYQMHFPNGRVHFFYNTGKSIVQDTSRGIKDLLSGSFVEPGLWNKIYQKKLFEDIEKKMDFSIKNNEDLLMNYFLFANSSKSIYEDFCPYYYMIRYESASRGRLDYNKIFDPIKVRKIIYEETNGEIKIQAKRNYISCCINCYNALLDTDEWKTERKEIRRRICNEHRMFNVLRGKKRIAAYLIWIMPFMYSVIEKLYTKHFRTNKYS